MLSLPERGLGSIRRKFGFVSFPFGGRAAAEAVGHGEAFVASRPTDVDIQKNMELEKFLADSRLHESVEGASKREEVLDSLRNSNNGCCVGPEIDKNMYLLEESLDAAFTVHTDSRQ
ncbi:nuclear poly(a) polymerase, partial [Striga asiatica]